MQESIKRVQKEVMTHRLEKTKRDTVDYVSQIEVGDWMRIYQPTSNKLENCWSEPVKVIEKKGTLNLQAGHG